MRTILLGCLLALPVAAQDAAPTRLLRAEVAGPAAWHMRLRPTNLGTVLASAEGEALWRPLAEQLGGMLQGILGADGDTVPRGWLQYGGRVRVEVFGRAGEGGGDPLVSARVVFATDADQDVTALATSTLRLCAPLVGVQFAPAFEGSDLGVARLGEWVVTMPKAGDGGAAVYFGNDVAGVRRLLATDVPTADPRSSGLPPLLDVAFDLHAAERLRVASGGAEQREMAALGFGSLRTLGVTVGARGPHVEAEWSLTFGDEERGVFAGVFPATQGVPDLFWAVPEDARAWKVGRLDCMAIWHAVLRAVARENETPDEKAAEAKKETGVDIEKELLAHLTDEVIFAWNPKRNGEDEADDIGMLLALRLRDEAAFKAAFRKLLANSDEIDVRDVDGVLRAGQAKAWFIPAFSFAVGNGVAAVGVGDHCTEIVDAMLARAGRKVEMPADFDVLARSAPAGWNSVGQVELRILLREYLSTFLDVLEVPTGAARDGVGETLETGILPMLATHRLDRVLTMTGCTGSAWRFRVLW